MPIEQRQCQTLAEANMIDHLLPGLLGIALFQAVEDLQMLVPGSGQQAGILLEFLWDPGRINGSLIVNAAFVYGDGDFKDWWSRRLSSWSSICTGNHSSACPPKTPPTETFRWNFNPRQWNRP